MTKEIIKTAIPYLIVAIVIIYLLKKTKEGVRETIEGIKTGDIVKSAEEKATDREVKAKTEAVAKNWFQKELELQAKDRTQIKRATALGIANNLHNELRNTIQTMTGADQIYLLLSKIGTLGSLYYVLGEFGIRDGMDLPSYLYKKVGFSNIFSKDLDEVNEMFRKRKINFQF